MKYRIVLALLVITIASFFTPKVALAAIPSDVGDPCVADNTTTPPTIYVCVNGTVCNKIKNQCEAPTAGSATQASTYLINPAAPAENSVLSIIAIPGVNGLITSPVFGGGPALGRSLQAMYTNKPAETAVALKDFKDNITGAKTAYAQGFGFQSLNPIIGIWRVVRNIALAGFVVIFIIIGLMIMLRKNIDPRTVVTVQQAIPKIIVSLILVIFSYAICGLLVDSITVATKLGLTTLQSTGLVAQGNGNADGKGRNITRAQNINILTSMNIFGLFENLYNVDNLVKDLSAATSLDPDLQGLGFDVVKDIFKFGVSGSLLRTILLIAVFVAMLRTFFMLLTTYLTIVMKIIFSPFQFLMMALPGSSNSFGSWVRGMYTDLLVFPVVFFMLCFAAIFTARAEGPLWMGYPGENGKVNQWNVSFPQGGNEQGVFAPGVSFWAPPGIGDWGDAVGPLLALGIILTVPKASAMVREAINPKARPGAHEGAASGALREAAGRIPILKSYI